MASREYSFCSSLQEGEQWEQRWHPLLGAEAGQQVVVEGQQVPGPGAEPVPELQELEAPKWPEAELPMGQDVFAAGLVGAAREREFAAAVAAEEHSEAAAARS